MAGLTDNPFGNCRIYYELFDGVHDDDVIRGVKMRLNLGGTAANIYYSNFQVSLYGRAGRVDSENVVTIYRALVTRPAGEDWVAVNINEAVDPDLNVRTLVLKLEATEVNSIVQLPTASKLWQDQWYSADPAPWHVRLRSYTVFASTLGRRITPRSAITDIVSPYFTVTGGKTGPVLDQLAFVDLITRLEALDSVNEMEGYDYYIWDDVDELVLQNKNAGTVKRVHSNDPAISYDFTENTDLTYNAARVRYPDHRGEMHEVIVKKRAPGLGSWGRTHVKADTIDAPEGCKSRKGAIRAGKRYLRDHDQNSIDGSVTVTGISETLGDALLIRPGDRYTIGGAANVPHRMKSTRVELRPLEWTADIKFEVTPTGFTEWLARVGAGAHSRKR
ncbi:MAG: hypothetical protein ABFE13_12055 [Phycisphaerales bacterium]